ncbi:ABC transporter ATP-binding protein [Faecalibaculum rodentium]|jgi:putative ABC transport system ATP-binding protein|uniref:ABC transporter ATP-binding protein n=2 Tax=Faecalibaculum rodentium TaxID=1702221 RepID=A0A1Q9YJT5_9FIRM|nr:ATP-binding cassette domain-containing protein [Faecalibaculum rodentium]OLU44793.1 ABC transporter ATP-binding protein [Faecalibaculum rodentium]
MLELKDVSVIFNQGTSLEKRALDEVSVHIPEGQFVTVLGSNGAGKSTFFNVITGAAPAAEGTIVLDGQDITAQKEHVRSRSIGRLFQNPEHGTAPHLTVEENLALAYSRSRGPFSRAIRKEEQALFREKLKTLDMGLEDRLKTPIGLLSGGQRQAVALMMAVLNPPKLLLLDEHTAALDPKSARKILEITNDLVRREHMTALMITHNMTDALTNGDRLLIFNDGKITQDFSGEEKKKLKPADLLDFYEV